ncbi:MAG: serine/threonine protein kinase [Phycisphaeraceae bacterium]|nr:serine/threonine protein kinase [Phycisphaeraceae bacterium]
MNSPARTPAADPAHDDPALRRRLAPALESNTLLADAIHDDGTALNRVGVPVRLDRYLAAVEDLARRPEPLDAALSVVLTSMVQLGATMAQAVQQLQADHPALRRAIEEAAALNDAVLSTTDLENRIVAPASRDLPSAIGPRLPSGHARYELTSRLGYGAYGQVYLARDRLLSEPDSPASVAIKVLPAVEGLTVVPEEATKARRVEHPNVVRVLDSGRDQGDDFIVCEYVDGGSLAEWLLRHPPPMPARQAATLMLGVARGVQAAHAAGLVHCDLKPGNILLATHGAPKVADFGIAVRAGNSRAHAPRSTGRPHGNLAFISPEQFRAEPSAFSPPSDVYALGGLLYLLLTGAMPNGDTPEQVAATHHPTLGRRSPPEFPPRPRIDRDLVRICARALEPDPALRYGSAGQFADDLAAWLDGFPIAWTRPGPWRSLRLVARRQPVALLMFGVWSFTLVAGATAFTLLMRQLGSESDLVARQREAALSVRAELPRVITLEVQMLQPFLAEADANAAYRSARIASLRQTIDLSRRAGREQLLLWSVQEAKLLVWLLAEGDWKTATPMIEDARRRWSELVGPEDPWLDGLTALALHAKVDALTALSAATPRVALLAPAVEVREQLTRVQSRLGADAPGSGLHAVVLAALEALHGPALLDDPAAVQYWQTVRIVSGALPVDAHGSHRRPVQPIQGWSPDSPNAP